MELTEKEQEVYINCQRAFEHWQATVALALQEGFTIDITPNKDIGPRPVIIVDQIKMHLSKRWP